MCPSETYTYTIYRGGGQPFCGKCFFNQGATADGLLLWTPASEKGATFALVNRSRASYRRWWRNKDKRASSARVVVR